jgi:hypothetical protein
MSAKDVVPERFFRPERTTLRYPALALPTILDLPEKMHQHSAVSTITLGMSLCCVSRLLKCYVECHYAVCRYAECRYAECHSAKCRYAECRYAECHGAINTRAFSLQYQSKGKSFTTNRAAPVLYSFFLRPYFCSKKSKSVWPHKGFWLF